MENGTAALKLTTASYWRPSGKNIHRFPDSKETDEWGVKPNAGYEIKLSDEDRLMYYKWRRQRDIVRAKGAPALKIEEKDKVDPKFKDQVLEKAKEYILGEQVKKEGVKQGAAPAVAPNPANAAMPAAAQVGLIAQGWIMEPLSRAELRRRPWNPAPNGQLQGH
jgi:hypothetical protein